MSSILVVEDDDAIRGLLVDILVTAGYSVNDAANGKEAVKAARARNYDVVLLDVVMPDMGGIETIVELRQINPKQRAVFVSGRVDVDTEHFKALAEKLGAVSVLSKPFSNEELLKAVQSALSP